jgi:RNA polymerase primary sigma factor
LASRASSCAWRRRPGSSARVIARYTGSEHNPRWLDNLAELTGKGWRNFSGKHREEAKNLRGQILEIAGATLLPIPEFCRVVRIIQKGEREASRAKKEMVEANPRNHRYRTHLDVMTPA